MEPSLPSSNTSSAPSAASAAAAEEPEYLARYLVIKHSWRGRYKRILCISGATIVTLDPSTLAVTNSYDVGVDFEGASPVIGRAEGEEGSSAMEFTVSVRTEGKGKFKGVKFSSRLRASILTELHRIGRVRVGPPVEFSVMHLRRRTSEWVPYVSALTINKNVDSALCSAFYYNTSFELGILA